MTRARSLVAWFALSAGAYALVFRPRMLRWGASDEEVRQPFPGAELVPGGQRGATMAVTIDAPPSRVWPWLVQMGYGRAGWYSYDQIDMDGESADSILDEHQDLAEGDRMPTHPGGGFEVRARLPQEAT